MRWTGCWSEGAGGHAKWQSTPTSNMRVIHADDLVILIDAYKRHDWLIGAVDKRLSGGVRQAARLRSMMKRAAQWTLSAVSASGSWASTSGVTSGSLRGALRPH